MTHPFEECNSKCYPLTLYLSNIEEDIVVFLSGNVTVQLPQFTLFLSVFRIHIILMWIRIRIRGSVSVMMDPDPGSDTDPDPDPR